MDSFEGQTSRSIKDNVGPFYWRVAGGVLYSEMALSKAIRPPLLSKWESIRVQEFRNRDRRARWLAGRTLAKALVKERLNISGIVEIREGISGEPLVFEDGFPRDDIWLSISVRHNRVSCVIADRPIAIEVRQAKDSESELTEQFISRSEQRYLKRALGSVKAAHSAGWAIKEAAQKAARVYGSMRLSEVNVDAHLGVQVGEESRLQVLGLRYIDDVAVAVVGRSLLEEEHQVKIVLDEAAKEQATPRIQAAIERSIIRARRITEARNRWQQGASSEGA